MATLGRRAADSLAPISASAQCKDYRAERTPTAESARSHLAIESHPTLGIFTYYSRSKLCFIPTSPHPATYAIPLSARLWPTSGVDALPVPSRKPEDWACSASAVPNRSHSCCKEWPLPVEATRDVLAL